MVAVPPVFCEGVALRIRNGTAVGDRPVEFRRWQGALRGFDIRAGWGVSSCLRAGLMGESVLGKGRR